VSEQTDGERLDDAAMLLADGYAKAGFPAFLIRVTEEGNIRIIGPKLPVKVTADMLRSAADCYSEQVHDGAAN
jgi:hypothetical protein